MTARELLLFAELLARTWGTRPRVTGQCTRLGVRSMDVEVREISEGVRDHKVALSSRMEQEGCKVGMEYHDGMALITINEKHTHGTRNIM